MKLLLFLVWNLICTGAFAQVPNQRNQWTIPSPDSMRNFKGNNNEQLRKQFEEYFERKKIENQLMADKQGNIVRLLQNHMPCVVPDSATAALIPNAWSAVAIPFQSQHQPIPNPALPPPSSRSHEHGDSVPAPSK